MEAFFCFVFPVIRYHHHSQNIMMVLGNPESMLYAAAECLDSRQKQLAIMDDRLTEQNFCSSIPVYRQKRKDFTMDLKGILAKLLGRKPRASTPGMTFPENSAYSLRHQLEYRLLPAMFLRASLNSSTNVFEFWKSTYEKNQLPFSYHEKDFHVEETVSGDGTKVCRIDLPEPEEEGLCWRIYCLHNVNERFLVSFAMEKSRKKKKTQVVAIRADLKCFPLGVFPLYLPEDKDFASMMSAEAVMMLNFLQKTL